MKRCTVHLLPVGLLSAGFFWACLFPAVCPPDLSAVPHAYAAALHPTRAPQTTLVDYLPGGCIQGDQDARFSLWDPESPVAEQAAGQPQIGYTKTRALCVLVDFDDVEADPELPPEYFNRLIFSRESHATGSLADFLHASSYGRMDFGGAVHGWVRAPRPMSFYEAGALGVGPYPQNVQYLAEQIILKLNAEIDFSRFDNDGPDGIPNSGDDDGFVDALMLIYATNSDGAHFAPLKWQTTRPIAVDGVRAYGFSVTHDRAPLGTHAHEFGHLLGLPDLYGDSFRRRGLGVWSLMGLGSGGAYPVDFDAWCKYMLGFAPVVSLLDGALKTVSLKPTLDGGTIYRLRNLDMADYFLVDARRAQGVDRNIPGDGLLIYHIANSGPISGPGDAVSSPAYFQIALEQADGLFELEGLGDQPSSGDTADPFQQGGGVFPIHDSIKPDQ